MPKHKHIINTGLVLNYDCGNVRSIKTGDTSLTDMTSGFTGTFVNGPAFSASTNGGVMELDGVNDYITVPHNGSLSFTATNFTVSVWQKVISITGFHGIITNDKNGDDAWKIYNDFGQGFYTARCNYGTLTFSPFTLGRFHHYTFTFSGTTLRNYTDGVLNLSTAATIAPVGENNIALGKYRFNDNNLYAKQQIAQVMLYDRALTSEEILYNYNASKYRYR